MIKRERGKKKRGEREKGENGKKEQYEGGAERRLGVESDQAPIQGGGSCQDIGLPPRHDYDQIPF